MMIFGWLTFVAVAASVVVSCFAVLKFYADAHQSRHSSMFVATVTLSLAILCLLVMPLDIYNISSSAPQAVIESSADTIRLLYYILFIVLLFFAFFFVPFTLFYHEVGIADDHMTSGQRACHSCKYTSVVLVILGALVVASVYVAPAPHPKKEQWYLHLMKNMADVDKSMSFIMGAIASGGLLSWLTYTAAGLAIVPVQLLIMSDNSDVAMSSGQQAFTKLSMVKEKIRVIEVKYQLSGRPFSSKDRKELQGLREESSWLTSQIKLLEGQHESCCTKIKRILSPFRILLGASCCLMSLLIVVSFAVANLDRTLNSHCGAECGFSLDKPAMFNPLDSFFVLASKVFPADYVMLCCLVVYLVIATLEGISGLGLRCMWVQLFSFKRRSTDPTALLLGVAIVASMILTVIVEILSVVPQYATFGSKQVKGKSCELGAAGCHMSEISRLVHRVMAMPCFAFVFFYATWIFVVVFTGALFCALAFQPKHTDYVHPDEPDI